MIKAIVFDFDGLIFDSESSMVAAWQAVYGRFNLEFPLDRWRLNIGTNDVFDPLAHLEAAAGRPVDREALYREVRSLDDGILAGRGLMPGVQARIDEARGLGLKLAIASSSPARWLNYHLPRLGLLFSFEAVRTCTDVEDRKKPDPAVYLAACEAIRVAPAQAIALEDSMHGIHAARAAGMKTVAVPNEVTRPMDFSAADLMINSLEEMTIARIIETLAQNGTGDETDHALS